MKKYITIGTITLLVILTILSFSDDPSVNEKYLNYMTVVGIIIILSIIIKSFINRQEEYDQNHQLHDPKLDELRSSLMPMFDGSVKYNGVLDHLNGRKVLEEIESFIDKDRIKLQYLVGSEKFRIDMVILDKSKNMPMLAIECDGYAYHSSPQAYLYDMYRQKILEKKGFVFYRIWSTNWFYDTKNEREKLINKIQELDALDRVNAN